LCFLAGLGWRLFFFVVAIFRERTFTRYGAGYRIYTLAGVAVPFHRALFKKPVYAALRYAFHACLFIVPVWFSGHVYLWEDSRFEWYWKPLPDMWSDRMTLAVLGACGYFMVRRIVDAKHLETGIADLGFVFITAMPFLSGYLLTHGHLNEISFFDRYLWHLHVFSGEVMLVMIVVLFCRTRMDKGACVGCAACVENCPTETLEFENSDHDRRFLLYSRLSVHLLWFLRQGLSGGGGHLAS
jgi:hypothetical protein